MLRDLVLLLVNRPNKHIYFLVNVPPPEAFFSLKCTKYRLAAGLRPNALGELTELPRPLDGFKERTSKGRGGRGGEVRGESGREGRNEWGWKGEYASLALGGMDTPDYGHKSCRK